MQLQHSGSVEAEAEAEAEAETKTQQQAKPPAPPTDEPKTPKTWERLFTAYPEAVPHFRAILEAQAATRKKLLARGGIKPVPLDPTPGGRSFVALLALGNSARVLRACHLCYLRDSGRVDDGYLQTLEVFFGTPGGKSKATWEGFLPDARLYLRAMESKSSPEEHPQVQGENLPTLPASFFANIPPCAVS